MTLRPTPPRHRGPAWSLAALLLAMLALFASGPALAAVCPPVGQWQTPEGEALDTASLFDRLSQAEVVLLGEQHDATAHHRWQLHTLTGLHARRPDLRIGLEMLPQSAQPALDAWVAGEIDRDTFLRDSDWYRVWGYDAELYMPILHFARMHRVPLVALNIERELAQRIAEEGWEAVPQDERHGIPPAVDPPQAYRDWLESVFRMHPSVEGGSLERFIRAQLVWDRAMAAGIAQHLPEDGLVVGLMGRGHVEHGHGVPHQLIDLGVADAQVLLPWQAGVGCPAPESGIAHAVFGIHESDLHDPPAPQLGVFLQDDEQQGARIQGVREGSVAWRAGLREDDRVVQAAGRSIGDSADLSAIVRRQAPGTWLPLTVLREDGEIELFARFPVNP